MLSLLWELVRKDLKIYVADRRSLVISFMVPVIIASFMAVLFGNMGNSSPNSGDGPKVEIAVASADNGPVAKDILDRLQKSPRLKVTMTDADSLRKSVQDGKLSYGVIFPAGFADQAVAAMGTKAPGPKLTSVADPAQQIPSQMAVGSVTEAVMGAVVAAKYGAFGVSSTMPFTEERGEAKATPTQSDNYNGVAHAFAGMAMQGLLFVAVESAMAILRERRQGIWRRLRAAPVSPTMLLLGKLFSGALRSLLSLTVVFGFGAIFFHIHMDGSWIGFGLIAVAAALMTSAFGLLVAALGRNEQQSRGLSILAVLTMMMLGGAWFPLFLMPQWIQTLALAIPVRWAVDGFDGMTWRAQTAAQALPNAAVLLAFTAVFSFIAVKRIRWEYEV